jgi:hypothetical protein
VNARLLVAALFAAVSASVAAEQVYRCGPEGRIYQNKPCEQGKAVDVADPRSAAQHKLARAAAKADARLADDLERDRRARETGTLPAAAAGFNARPAPPEPAASASAKAKKKSKSTSSKAASQPNGFVAVVPPPQKPKATRNDAQKP